MANLLNRARMTTATTGQGTLTLGSAVSGFLSFAEAGAADSKAYPYVLVQGSDFEIGIGTYTASSTTFSRDTVTASKISGTAGTTKLTLAAGGAQIFISPRAADLNEFLNKHTLWIPAAAMTPRASSGAGQATYDSGSNDITIPALAFDTTTQEYAHFSIGMPKGWDEGSVTFIPYWTNTGGASTQTVAWTLAGVAISNDDPLNATMGSAQTSSDTWLALDDLHIGPESSAITIGGTPAEGDMVVFQVSRDVTNDNMAGDALLLGLKLLITYNAANDA
jgi:hypothetical protein